MINIWYRINTMAEKQFFDYKELVDGIIVPAHLLAFYDVSFSEFLKKSKLPFIIDPMTYLWSMDVSYVTKDDELKKSYKKYVEKLNCNIGNILGYINIYLFNYVESDLHNFISKVLSFQETLGEFEEAPRSKSILRIKKYQKKSVDIKIKPNSYVPPYFYFSNVIGTPYRLNNEIMKYTIKLDRYEYNDITPCLCMDKEVISDDDSRNRIIEDFSNFNQVIIWINDFDERLTNIAELSYFKDLINSFKDNGVHVINLYGCYFSVLLNYFGLDTFSSGINISHRKSIDSIPTGGGQPIRYYEPNIKMEIINEIAYRLYMRHPELFLCECPICREYFLKIKDITSNKENVLSDLFIDLKDSKGKIIRKAKMDWKNSRLHFLYCRKKEIIEQNNLPSNEIIKKLKDDYEYLSSTLDFRFYNFTSVEYLKHWYEIISERS